MSWLRTRSLRFQLAVGFLVVGLTPTLLLGTVAVATTDAALRKGVAARNEQIALSVAGEVERFLESHLLHLREVLLAAEERVGRPIGGEARHLALHLAANPAMRSILLLDPAGRVVAAAPPSTDVIGTDYSGQPWVREARVAGMPTWSSATIAIATGQPTVALVVPGKPWTAVGYLDLESLDRIAERIGGTAGTVAAVLDRDGTFIAHDDSRLVREQVNLGDVDLVARAGASPGAPRTGRFRFEGRTWLGSAVPVVSTRWIVLAMEPEETAFGSVLALRRLLLLGIATAAVLALGAGWFFTRRILRPVEALAASTRRLAAGELPAPHAEGAMEIDELDELGRLFDSMSAAVRAREKQLARSERSYRRIVDTPQLAVVRTDAGGRVLFANEGMLQLNGAAAPGQLLGRNVAELYADPEERDALLRDLQVAGRISNREVHLRTLQGRERVALANIVRDEDGFTIVLIDVTDLRRAEQERERLEQQLFHTQKVEAIGRLAGGVAHDFNNLLTAISGYANVLREDLPPGHDGREALDGILQASDRAAHLTRSLLAYGRKQVLSRRPVDLRDVVRDATRLIGRVLGEDVRFHVALPEAPVTVLADAGQIDQVLMNLCTNARDAMPAGGALDVRLDRAVLDAAEAAARELAAGGAFARLEVRDTGVGMTPDLLERAFEPFFTTKATGKGTGLGLSIVQGIVRQHDGAVGVASRPGEGTTVTILLPLLAREAAAESTARGSISAAPRGTETILLGEDDPQVRKVVRSILERGGYQVIEAADGREAVAAFEANRDRIALCLLDLVMPGLNGREVMEAIRRISPGARFLFSSGYAADVLEAGGTPAADMEIVAKPIDPPDLLRRVRERIDRR
jgi:PAS domain S-box-containing protein